MSQSRTTGSQFAYLRAQCEVSVKGLLKEPDLALLVLGPFHVSAAILLVSPNCTHSVSMSSIQNQPNVTTPVPTTQHYFHLENNQTLQDFDYLENGLPPEFQNIQYTVAMFTNVRVPEKRSKLLETLVGDTPVPVLALALACKSLSYHYCTRYLFPTGHETFRDDFEAELEHSFPTTAAQFANSLAQRTIKKLDSIYAPLPTSDFTRSLLEYRCAVLHVAAVFEAIKGLNFDSPGSSAMGNIQVQTFPSKKISQKQAKRARARGPSIDDTPFQKMGVSRPRSQSEYNKLTEDLLAGQKEILQVRTFWSNVYVANELLRILSVKLHIMKCRNTSFPVFLPTFKQLTQRSPTTGSTIRCVQLMHSAHQQRIRHLASILVLSVQSNISTTQLKALVNGRSFSRLVANNI